MNLLEYFLWGGCEELLQRSRRSCLVPSDVLYKVAIQLSRKFNTPGPHGEVS